MRANTLRRIAADLSVLHNSLPPNYLWPEEDAQDDLLSLDILLIGPAHTPYSDGLWRLHFDIPQDYPQLPPTANFRTPIFHPNVDQQTGAICVETLKRDWTSTLTLSDLLLTITCLLIQPNPDSALNAEAGALIQEDYELFGRRARLMTSIHAAIPKAMAITAQEAQERGQDAVSTHDGPSESGPAKRRKRLSDDEQEPTERAIPARRQRRPVHRPQRAAPRRSDGSPIAQLTRRRNLGSADQAPLTPDESDNSFSELSKARNSDAMNEDQENDSVQLPQLGATPGRSTPRRPPGPPIPLGELIIDSSESDVDEMDMEYPPSPRKSPRKHIQHDEPAPWSSLKPQTAVHDFASNTPAVSFDQDALLSKPVLSHKGKERCVSPPETMHQVAPALDEARLWDLCNHDIGRWNRGDFDGQPFAQVASRW